MEEVPVATRNGGVAQLGGPVLEALPLRGTLLRPDDDGFDRARSVWNAMIDRRPGLIVRCAGVADVRRAVALAREHDLLVSVRGGGHGVAGHAVAEGGLMLDLSPMTSVRVDPVRRRARVEPGAKLRDFDHEAQAFGLATPLGVISDTGVGGLTLGGGFGLLSRKHGLAIDNLISADVVTAEGELLHASEEEHPDLFWALRGGGGNFGVVTSFEFQLHPVGPMVLGGLVAFPLEQAREVMGRLATFAEEIPDDLSVQQTIVGFPAPPLPFLPDEVHGQKTISMVVIWTGDEEQGRAAIEPILSFGDHLGRMVGPIPYTEFQQMGDAVMTPPARNYWKSLYLNELTRDAIEVIADYGTRCPSQASQIILHQQGGRVARVATDATAYPHRQARFEVNVQGRWQDPAEDERVIAWARGIHRALAPFSSGSYLNADVGRDGAEGDAAGHASAVFGPNHRRLVDVKRRYDPGNLFRMNANVDPAA